VQSGLYAAGFLAYEAAAGLDGAFCTHPSGQAPLAWFGLFRDLRSVDEPAVPPQSSPVIPQGGDFHLGDWRPSLDRPQYEHALDRIKDYIARGDTYQVNYTWRLRAAFEGDPWPLFLRLCRAQQARYAAYLDTGRHVLCSASPELFFRLEGEDLLSRPMKGTSPRGLTWREDAALCEALAASPKERAENAMIVDMMRNDLGRVARRGSVKVLSAFDVEKYPTLWQMTSAVSARTSASLPEILGALFPAASITGAPKVRTMQIIRELEPDARGVYTGCIGWAAPRRQAQFNVAIRTVTIDRAAGQAEYGVGGGIVWDSSSSGEYAECHLKAAVLTADRPEFELLETLLYEAGCGYFLLEKHLQRLAESAAYFDFPLDAAAARTALEKEACTASGPGNLRVRLRLARGGRLTVEASPLDAPDAAAPRRLKLAPAAVDSRNVLLYHKTTWRQPYDAAYAVRGDCDDVVLWNERRQVTETTISNIVVQQAGRRVTPPLSCGLLPGVFRAHLIETGQIHEQIVTVDELLRAERVLVINSLRKWLPAVVVGGQPCPSGCPSAG
jgi:para-aminobenzoate synthetase/4-amino-4-deoxychorismate lyase